MLNIKINDEGVMTSEATGERDLVMAQLAVAALHILKEQSKDEAEFEGLKLQLMARIFQVSRDMVQYDWRIGEE